MTNIGRAFSILAITFLGLFFVNAAQAQTTRTWMSAVGDDNNPCSRTAPCKTLPGAYALTAPGGEINCLDPGGFGALTITKAITISCQVGTAGVLVSGSNGITVNAGPNDAVFIEGLDIEGDGASGASLSGIQFNSGAALHVKKCIIRGFAASPAYGINFTPGAAGSALYVEDSYISDNGAGTIGGGIAINPGAGASAFAVIDNVKVNNNALGVAGVGVGNAGVKLSIMNSTISGSALANLVADSTGGPVTIIVEQSVISNSTRNGVNAIGSGSVINLGKSIISGNAEASFVMSSGGLVQSYGDNDINGNGTDAAPPAAARH